MPDKTDESVTTVLDDAKKPEPAEKPTLKEEQDSLDWAKAVKDKALLENASVRKFKTLDDLIQSYEHLEKKIGADKGYTDITDKSKLEDISKVSKAVLKIDDEKYKVSGVDEKLVDVAKEIGLHPTQLKAYEKKRQAHFEEMTKVKEEDKIAQYKKELNEKFSDTEQLKRDLTTGLQALGFSDDEYKTVFGVEALNPAVIEKIVSAGQKAVKEDILAIKQGKSTGGLPSDANVLQARLKNLVRQQIESTSTADLREINKEIEEVEAKLQKAYDEGSTDQTFLGY